MELAESLRSLVRGRVVSDNQTLLTYSRDASIFEVRPEAVVVPEDVQDLKALVRFVSEKSDSKLSLTIRAGGTDMTGGPLSESLVIDIKNLNRIVSVGHRQAIVQPAAYYRDFEKATLVKNLLLPSYPASRQICTVGGMVANNSGGEKSLQYGQTVQYVHSIKAILADGNEYVFGPLTWQEAEQKAQSGTFEGTIYREMISLMSSHEELIKRSKPRVSKNSAGYQLWHVWDGHTFNVAKIFVGSQGTLGIITQITFDLIQPKAHSRLVVAFLSEVGHLPELVKSVQQFKPESFETYDDKTLSLAVRFFSEFVSLVGAKSVLSLAWQFLPEAWQVITGGIPKMVALIECTGDDEQEVSARAASVASAISAVAKKVKIVERAAEMEKYWAIRRESFNLLRHHLRNLQTAPFIDDVIVPVEKMSEFLPALEQILAPYNLLYSLVGHIGNGNFHIIPLVDLEDTNVREIIPVIAEKVYDLVIRMGGSITAEHNDGLIRTPFVEKMYGRPMYQLFQDVKAIFDPKNIFNPGKKVNGDWQYALKHIRHEQQAYQW